jgi:indole-3-glycerol phosphate synthase
MKRTETILDAIMVDVRREMAEAQARCPLPELRRMMADAPTVRSFKGALQKQFGIIAEIKERSPSHGPMRRENVEEAAKAYERSGIVGAISVLTNNSHFGMSMERLRAVKEQGTKPVLRKDFIVDEYQVFEARAHGADAILLMANLLEPEEMKRLYAVAKELSMDALFECHTKEQIEQLPDGAEIYGVNSRTFASGTARYGVSALLGKLGSSKDLTVDLDRFELGQYVPKHAIKVAESGVSAKTIRKVRDELGYHAALVGTSFLKAPHGIRRELELFEEAL